AMISLMRYGFKRENLSVIFQNGNDQETLQRLGAIHSQNKIFRIKGSGVNLRRFVESPFPDFETINILLPCRMLWDKGVKELKEATELLKGKYKGKIQFVLAGMADEGNKAGVPASYLKNWE